MSTLEIRIYCIFLVVKEKVKEFMAKWKIAAKGLEGTSDIHGNSKTRRGIHFMVELLFNKMQVLRAGPTQALIALDPLRILLFFIK